MKRIVRGIFCLIFVFVVSGCDRIYRLLQKEGAEEKALVGEVVPYEKNIKVAEVQRLLKLYGYRVGKADGFLGVNTRNAIEQFQKDNDLTVTRFVDKPTWERMNLFRSSGLVDKNKVNLKALQQALKNAGYDPGPVDGRPGKRTQEALEFFQQASGLKPDGKSGFKTLRKLAEYLAEESEQASANSAAGEKKKER